MSEHDGCVQEGAIGELRGMMRFFQSAEEKREKREERLVEAVEKVAAQGEILKNQGETLTRHEKALQEAFGRLRKVETPSMIIRLSKTKLGRIALATCLFMSVIGFVRNPEALGKFVKAIIQ